MTFCSTLSNIWSRTNEWHIPSTITNYYILLTRVILILCTWFDRSALYYIAVDTIWFHIIHELKQRYFFFTYYWIITVLLELLSYYVYITRLSMQIVQQYYYTVKIYDLGRSAVAGVVFTFIFARTVCPATANWYFIQVT